MRMVVQNAEVTRKYILRKLSQSKNNERKYLIMKKRLIRVAVSLLTIFILTFTVSPLFAIKVCAEATEFGNCGDAVVWSVDGETLTITGFGEMYDYEKETAPWYPYREEIREIVIDEGVTEIGDYAFYNLAYVRKVEIPDGLLSIGYCAFQYMSNITKITIPASVGSIEQPAFACCSSLEILFVEKDNPSFCTIESVLYSKDMTELLCYPAGKSDAVFTTPKGVTTIQREAFRDCYDLISVEIMEGVTTIETGAFWDCWQLSSACISESVTYIGADAFGDSWREADEACILTDVIYDGTEEQWASIEIDEDNMALKKANIRYEGSEKSDLNSMGFVWGVVFAGAVFAGIYFFKKKKQ